MSADSDRTGLRALVIGGGTGIRRAFAGLGDSGDVNRLVKNAGYARHDAWTDVTVEQWREVGAVHGEARLRLCNCVCRP